MASQTKEAMFKFRISKRAKLALKRYAERNNTTSSEVILTHVHKIVGLKNK